MYRRATVGSKPSPYHPIHPEGGEAQSGEEKGREEEKEVGRRGGEGVQPLPATRTSTEGGDAESGEEAEGRQEEEVGLDRAGGVVEPPPGTHPRSFGGRRRLPPKRLGRLDHLAGPQAACADAQSAGAPLHDRSHRCQVRQPAPLRHVVGVAHLVTHDRAFTAKLAALCHAPLLEQKCRPLAGGRRISIP